MNSSKKYRKHLTFPEVELESFGTYLPLLQRCTAGKQKTEETWSRNIYVQRMWKHLKMIRNTCTLHLDGCRMWNLAKHLLIIRQLQTAGHKMQAQGDDRNPAMQVSASTGQTRKSVQVQEKPRYTSKSQCNYRTPKATNRLQH